MHRHRGFTLIELLVVIAIIAILAAILIPALMKAKAKSEAAKCMSNLRNLAIAMQGYTSDNRSRYPGVEETAVPGLSWPNGRSDDGIWASRLDGYIGGSSALWICPANEQLGEQFRSSNASARSGIPYGMNNSLSATNAQGDVIGVPVTAPKAPGSTVLLIENDGYDAGGTNGIEPDPARRHGGGDRWFNVVYCDATTDMEEEVRFPEDWDLE
jgi:prepilin-type N-terminal cleavage/methylation domain-containing protein